VIRADKLSATVVQTGRKFGELIEVGQGLRPGDKVVLRPADKLRDGMVVRQARK
jgi:multidrug efflux pump subunit AcrA (membrane-fusion protein)